ncbi:MAG: metal ABC transporter permease [Alphaproteobacteria bacterium]
MDSFIINALLAGALLSLAAGPLGCLIVWRRMAFFGDALAHGALLGVGLGLVLAAPLQPFVILIALLFAVLLAWLEERQDISRDAALAVIAHGGLATGIVAISMSGLSGGLEAYLFGDVLAVNRGDLAWLAAGVAFVLLATARLWRPWLALIVHEELARAEGAPIFRLRLAFMALIAITVALAVKVVGALLVSALLVIPAVTARPFAATPERMALGAVVVAIAGIAGGLFASLQTDAPAGPAMVCVLVLFFALSRVISLRSSQ